MVFGFVYIWRDRKRKMFYIGSHHGSPDDGYICSSVRMLRAYKKRPTDFRRRIVQYNMVDDKSDTLKMEQQWLNLIPECLTGYYNQKRVAAGGRGNDRPIFCYGTTYPSLTEAKRNMSFSPVHKAKNRNDLNVYWIDEGPVTQDEIDSRYEKILHNRKLHLDNVASINRNLPPERHSARAIKAAKGRSHKQAGVTEKIRAKALERWGVPCICGGVQYPSVRHASERLNIQTGTIRKRIKSPSFPDWYMVNNRVAAPVSLQSKI